MSKSLNSAREERLAKLLGWARKIPGPLREIHAAHGPVAHLRPTSNGMTLVGLVDGRPQRGRGGFRHPERLVRDFEALFEEHCLAAPQGRDTPEKELQSALLRDAYLHERRMRLLIDATADTGDPAELLFVTDEIALPTDDGRRIVCDLLAVRGLEGGQYRPVVIELKSERAMKRLVEQVTTFASIVSEHQESFRQLAEALLEREQRFVAPCERWIVWPAATADGTEPRAEELSALGIRTVIYTVGDHAQPTFHAG